MQKNAKKSKNKNKNCFFCKKSNKYINQRYLKVI